MSSDPLSQVPKPEAVRAALRQHIEREAALRALLKASEAADRVVQSSQGDDEGHQISGRPVRRPGHSSQLG